MLGTVLCHWDREIIVCASGGFMFAGFLTTLLIIDTLVLIVLVVALQQGSEGGIGAAFGSGNSTGFFGASGGVDFIVRGTWIAGALFLILSTSLAWYRTHEKFGVGRELDENIELLEGATKKSDSPTSDNSATPGSVGTPATESLTPVASPADATPVPTAATPSP